MHYYIDGYNLMFRILRADDDLQYQREQIVQDLNQKINFLKIDATLVFDAQYQRELGDRHHLQLLEIRYTDHGETADEFIIDELKREKNPREHTVVTSDKKLAWRARRLGAKTEKVEEFIRWLNKRYKKRLVRKEPEKKKVEKKEKPIKKSSDPPKNATLNECFDYYLYTFEKEDERG